VAQPDRQLQPLRVAFLIGFLMELLEEFMFASPGQLSRLAYEASISNAPNASALAKLAAAAYAASQSGVEIRGNAGKDLAAVNKVEMLPPDEWGRMTAAYRDETGEDYDELLDEIATVCAADDPDAAASLYAHDDLRVPADIIS